MNHWRFLSNCLVENRHPLILNIVNKGRASFSLLITLGQVRLGCKYWVTTQGQGNTCIDPSGLELSQG